MQTKLISNQFRANRAFWCPVPTHDLINEHMDEQHTLIEDEVHLVEMRLFEPISKEFSEIAGNRANIGKNTSFTDFSELLLFLQSIIGHIRVGQAFCEI